MKKLWIAIVLGFVAWYGWMLYQHNEFVQKMNALEAADIYTMAAVVVCLEQDTCTTPVREEEIQGVDITSTDILEGGKTYSYRVKGDIFGVTVGTDRSNQVAIDDLEGNARVGVAYFLRGGRLTVVYRGDPDMIDLYVEAQKLYVEAIRVANRRVIGPELKGLIEEQRRGRNSTI